MPTDDDDRPVPLSRHALHVMALLVQRGGLMRMRPLYEAAGLDADELAAAVNELAQRRWVKVVWRGPDARRPDTVPARLREARCVATTRFGRWRYRGTWGVSG